MRKLIMAAVLAVGMSGVAHAGCEMVNGMLNADCQRNVIDKNNLARRGMEDMSRPIPYGLGGRNSRNYGLGDHSGGPTRGCLRSPMGYACPAQ